MNQLLVLFLLTGCGTFRSQWAATSNSTASSELAGRWEGTWTSGVNGHHGRLRCVVSQSSGDTFEFHYQASYRGVLRFSYTALFEVSPDDGGYALQGEKDLGALAGGLFRYQGRVDGDRYSSTYTSDTDHGIFEMQRVR